MKFNLLILLLSAIALFAQKKENVSYEINDMMDSKYEKIVSDFNSENNRGNVLQKLKYELYNYQIINSSQNLNSPEVSTKSPWLAFFLSFILPPAGQLYNGDYTKALIQAGLVYGGAGIAAGVACTECGDAGGAQTGLFIAGLTMVVSGYLWSIFDAPISASDHNSRIKSDRNSEFLSLRNSELSLSVKNYYQKNIYSLNYRIAIN